MPEEKDEVEQKVDDSGRPESGRVVWGGHWPPGSFCKEDQLVLSGFPWFRRQVLRGFPCFPFSRHALLPARGVSPRAVPRPLGRT